MKQRGGPFSSGRSSELDSGYWPGFTDLMAGLILVLAIVTVLSQSAAEIAEAEAQEAEALEAMLAIETAKVTELEEMRATLEKRRDELQTQLEAKSKYSTALEEQIARLNEEIDALNAVLGNDGDGDVKLAVDQELERLEEWKRAVSSLCKNERLLVEGVRVDCETGTIELPDEFFFEFNKHDLTDEGKRRLREAIPIVLEELRQSAELWRRIDVLEVRGHADPVVRVGHPYQANLRKSQDRAYAVLEFLTSDSGLAADDRRWIQARGVAAGVANERPPSTCADRQDEACHNGMRRVELLLGFQDEDIRKNLGVLLEKVQRSLRG